MGRLEGRIAIITGAGKGIGKATAIRFAKEGAKVAIAARSEGPGLETKQAIENLGGEALLIVGDISDREHCRRVVAQTAEHFGGIDIVLHNAAYTEGGRIDRLPDDKLALTFNTGLMPCFWLTADALPHLKKSKAGRILVTSSILGNLSNRAGRSAYGALKTGITGFIRAAAAEVACHGITVNAVQPGTTMADSIDRLVPPDTLKEMIKRIPLGRMITGDEIGLAFTYLASDDAAMVSGTTLTIDGAETAGFPDIFDFDDY
jgi:3-oxoacyl-[acyl-carrier protein] reductase